MEDSLESGRVKLVSNSSVSSASADVSARKNTAHGDGVCVCVFVCTCPLYLIDRLSCDCIVSRKANPALQPRQHQLRGVESRMNLSGRVSSQLKQYHQKEDASR